MSHHVQREGSLQSRDEAYVGWTCQSSPMPVTAALDKFDFRLIWLPTCYLVTRLWNQGLHSLNFILLVSLQQELIYAFPNAYHIGVLLLSAAGVVEDPAATLKY